MKVEIENNILYIKTDNPEESSTSVIIRNIFDPIEGCHISDKISYIYYNGSYVLSGKKDMREDIMSNMNSIMNDYDLGNKNNTFHDNVKIKARIIILGVIYDIPELKYLIRDLMSNYIEEERSFSTGNYNRLLINFITLLYVKLIDEDELHKFYDDMIFKIKTNISYLIIDLDDRDDKLSPNSDTYLRSVLNRYYKYRPDLTNTEINEGILNNESLAEELYCHIIINQKYKYTYLAVLKLLDIKKEYLINLIDVILNKMKDMIISINYKPAIFICDDIINYMKSKIDKYQYSIVTSLIPDLKGKQFL